MCTNYRWEKHNFQNINKTTVNNYILEYNQAVTIKTSVQKHGIEGEHNCLFLSQSHVDPFHMTRL